MKNKKDIVTFEALERELEKKTNMNKDLRSQIKAMKIEIDILKRKNMTIYKPKDWRSPVKKLRNRKNSLHNDSP